MPQDSSARPRLSALLVSLLFCFSATLSAQAPAQKASSTVPAILLSDIHFDPFTDPAKFARLRVAGAEDWNAIFAAPASPNHAADFAQLNAHCSLRGSDTPWPLLQSSLAAAHEQSPNAAFVVVSGDLMAHEFDCRFRHLAPAASAQDLSAFAFKTVAFVALQFRHTFGATPVYVALGNNDSGCGDYHEAAGSAFLRALAQSLAGMLQSPSGQRALEARFPASGGYSVPLPAPIANGRLLVLQDIFFSRLYQGCNGKPDPAAATEQLDWFRAELTSARAHHEHVWVVAHIPPGVDVYSTITHHKDVCSGQKPEMFLADERLAATLTDFADVVRLALFAHTHMDEIHLLTSPDGKHAVPAKFVPSISPINGNLPAFLLADVDPRTATLVDFRAIAASNFTGVATTWSEEYRFSTLFHQPAFTPEHLAPLLHGFLADLQGIQQSSTDYQQNVFTGGGKGSIAVHLFWPNYACSLTNNTPEAYRNCLCPSSQTPHPTDN